MKMDLAIQGQILNDAALPYLQVKSQEDKDI